MEFLPYRLAAEVPNIIVDGAGNDRTVLTLSHWPRSGSPLQLRADTSTAIVFNYLDTPGLHVEAHVVSNNHFDEDGLVGIFALLQPDIAQRHRSLLIDVAQAGDFGVFERRRAARIAFTLAAYADPESSPLPAEIFTRPYAEVAGELYVQLLEVLPRLITRVEDFQHLWEREDAALTTSEKRIALGQVTITEVPDIDLAIVTLRDDTARREVHRFALHNRTTCSRLLFLQGRHAEFTYRYESWVQFASRRPAPRVDLSDLARELNEQETTGGRWVFDGVDQITPRLHLEGSAHTSVPLDTLVTQVEHHLRTGPSAWNPYD